MLDRETGGITRERSNGGLCNMQNDLAEECNLPPVAQGEIRDYRGYCGRWAYYHPVKGYAPFRCGHVSCYDERCRKLFHARRIRLVDALVKEYGLIRFFTLTIPQDHDIVKTWAEIHHTWSKFRWRMSRMHKSLWRFVAVLEEHKSGYPHIHGFTSVWMKQAQWSDLWVASGGGPVVWIEQVRDIETASEYLTKQLDVSRYIGKQELAGAQYRKGHHHTLWRSTHMKAAFELQTASGWCIIKDNVYDSTGELSWLYKEKQYGKLETARSALPQGSIAQSVKDVERTSKEKHEQEDPSPNQETPGAERQYQ